MSLGITEITLILVVILLLFGGKRIPELARSLGRASYEFKKAKDAIKKELPDAKIILLCPAEISNALFNSYFSTMFDKSSIEKSKHLPAIYKNVAKDKNCKFIDLNKIAKVSDKDGLHYEAEEHKKIAQAIYNELENLTIY